LFFLHDLPEPVGVGIGRNALKHERSSPKGQWAIDDITVTRDPADVCRAKENILFFNIKTHLRV
jgi:hypothetical protein